jgi:alginate O-acetyltransferase complex protein AlgI
MDAVVDITSLKLWAVFGAAVCLLTPIVVPSRRRVVLAGLNLGFVGLCAGGHAVVGVAAGVVLTWLWLRTMRNRRLGPLAAMAGLVIALGLFALHKAPQVSAGLGARAINPLLTTIGFSYVLLRLIEVGRAVAEGRHVAPGLVALVNYVLPFHMLAAGPVQAYDEFVAQPAVPPPLSTRAALEGAERVAQGLFKKFVLATVLLQVFSTGWQGGGWYRVVEMNVHFLWLYLDFSAYSDIAVGLGRLMGLATPENFNRPYLARNLTDFWERWHISLSQFIRRHLFVPLQLAFVRQARGRRPLLAASLALGIAFLLCGLWHGLTWPFFAWGALHAVGLVASNLYKELLRRRLGPAGVRAYLASTPIRVCATVATFEFVAFSVMLVGQSWRSPW